MKALLPLLALAPLCVFANDFQEKYLPLTQGETQEYQTTKERVYILPNGEKKMTLKETVVETLRDNTYEAIDVEGAFMIQKSITQKNPAQGTESHDTLNEVYTLEDGQLLLHAYVQSGQPLAGEHRISPPSLVMDFKKMEAGELYDSKLTVGDMTINAGTTGYEYASLETPTGDYDDVLRVHSTGTITGQLPSPNGQPLSINDGDFEETSWYAPGVGLVRQEQTISMTIQVNESLEITSRETKTKELTSTIAKD